ncbi:MAG TPA: hypothetical protein VF211_02615 [Burkholderiales bacterium]
MARTFFLSLVLATAPLAAAAADGDAAEPPLVAFEAGLPVATPPALYSFADVYRLAVAGDPLAAPRWIEAETQLRLASRAAPAGPRFAVSAPRDGGRWALVLAGLAACAWVAHRRLTSPY